MTTRRISLVLLSVFLCSIGICGVATAQDETGKDQEITWFDMDHCDVCNNFASMKDSMHKIKWENHLLDDGMISVSVVPDELKEDMAEAQAGIQATIVRMTQGEQVDMCGHCNQMGKLMGMGAKFKEIKTVGVDITLVTSSDPEVVKQIHAFAKKSKTEHDTMLKQIAAEK